MGLVQLVLTTCVLALDHTRQVRSTGAVLYHLKYETEVNDLLAKTVVIGKIRNNGDIKVEIVIPPNALITSYSIETGGKKFESVVLSQEEALKIKTGAAVTSRGSTITKSATVRDTNTFTDKIKVVGQKASFRFSYQELLQSHHSSYQVVTSLFPPDFVANLQVKVKIHESMKLSNVTVLPFTTGTGPIRQGKNPHAIIIRTKDTLAEMYFRADLATQKQIAAELGNARKFGCQLIVQFNTEEDCQVGNYLQQGSHFMYLFSPCRLEDMPTEIVFVLDTSESMNEEEKIANLKKAMDAIFDHVHESDYYTIVQFSNFHDVYTADGRIDISQASVVASKASRDNLKKMQKIIRGFKAEGATDIKTALEIALNIVKKFETVQLPNTTIEPIIIFLTDGKPDCGEASCAEDTDKIISHITAQNSGTRVRVPILSLSFGKDADKDFLQKLSNKNEGAFRHIYAGKDASEQLEAFYKEYASLVLKNVKISTKNSKSTTKTKFPRLFANSKLQTAGKRKGRQARSDEDDLPRITAIAKNGSIKFTPTQTKPVGRLDDHWATLSVTQILEARHGVSDTKKLDQAAGHIALHYKFVTPVTPLLVRGPDGEEIVRPEKLSKSGGTIGFSVSEDDLNLDEFIAEDFDDYTSSPERINSVGATSGTLKLYSSGLIVLPMSLYVCCV